MTDKSDFTPDEWKLLLESVMMAGIAVTAAEPSGLWGLLKESFAGGSALVTAKMDGGSNPLIKAVVADFETGEGRSIGARRPQGKTRGKQARRDQGQVHRDAAAGWGGGRRQGARTMRRPSRAGCGRSASTLPRQPRRAADFSASAAYR